MAYSLRLIEDRLAAGADAPVPRPGAPRVLYAVSGTLLGAAAAGPVPAVGPADPTARAGADGARVYRVELVRQPPPAAGARVLLEHPIDLAAGRSWLMRCDRVDFEPGGVAPLHRHRGGGIRCLLRGRLDVTVGEGAPRAVAPGEAWFESGREPVLAVSSRETETSFIRVSILPAEILGQSSILYVDPADAGRGRPRRYTVYVDEPIAP
ncbi:MAG TPA: cupin domain-containing protein [Candidatus Bathyarchaeia archaeon]|nr:cupin domain-containing protein [Candidatus Bathyarchaeia archaeon]